VLAASNGLRFLKRHSLDDITGADFNPVTLTERVVMEWTEADGTHWPTVGEHGHHPEELRTLFGTAGFAVERTGGGTAGRGGLQPLNPEEYEIMLIAERARGAP
jgi:hypothetical protein